MKCKRNGCHREAGTRSVYCDACLERADVVPLVWFNAHGFLQVRWDAGTVREINAEFVRVCPIKAKE